MGDFMDAHYYRENGQTLWGAPYRLTFFMWRRLPLDFRNFISTTAMVRSAKIAGRNMLARFAGRDDLYNNEYYSYVDSEASRSAAVIVGSTLSAFAAKRLIDVGCGTGALLTAFQSKGISCTGLECSQAALKICTQRGLNVSQFNIESGQTQNLGSFDLAVCFEVAEHVSAKYADPLVDMLVRLAPIVLFTAATPGQGGGADHVNEQPHGYWIDKFEGRGHHLVRGLTEQWRREWNGKDVAGFYSKNIMIFAKT